MNARRGLAPEVKSVLEKLEKCKNFTINPAFCKKKTKQPLKPKE